MPIPIEEFRRKEEYELLIYGGKRGMISNFLEEGDKAFSVGEISKEFNMTAAAVSNHLKKLIEDQKVVKKGSYFCWRQRFEKKK